VAQDVIDETGKRGGASRLAGETTMQSDGHDLRWLKHLENRSRQPEATDPMATYDFAWLWRELKVEDLRR
jgi:hypothetical protein